MSLRSKKFNVGDAVFILNKEDGTVVPGVVFKRMVSQNLNSEEEISWHIMVGPQNNREIIDSSQLSESFMIFSNAGELRDALYEQVIEVLFSNVQNAMNQMTSWYKNEIPEENISKANSLKNKTIGSTNASGMSFSDLAGTQIQRRKPRKSKKQKETIEEVVSKSSVELTSTPPTKEFLVELESDNGEKLLLNKITIGGKQVSLDDLDSIEEEIFKQLEKVNV